MNTKKLVVFILSVLVSAASFAQKGSVNKATAYSSKGDYANAKAEIDVAITIEKTAAKSKTWFERGKIYQAIATSEEDAIKGLDAEAITKASEAYNKVLAMEKEDSPTSFLATQNIDNLWGAFVNKGGEQYGEEKFAEALLSFETALLVKNTDSLTLLYAGVAAQQAGMYDKTLLYYNQMIEAGVAGSDVYSTLIYLLRSEKKDNEKALDVTMKAKEAYPEEKKFAQEEISLLLTMDKVDEAKTKLEAAIATDPNNANLYLNLGVLYDNLGSALATDDKNDEARAAFDQAMVAYKKAIEIEPDNFIGNFNTGVIYVNLAKEYFDQVRDMDLKTYDKKGPAVEAKGREVLEQGIPYLEKASSIKPQDCDVIRALQQVYTAMKMMDKAEAIMNKADDLGCG